MQLQELNPDVNEAVDQLMDGQPESVKTVKNFDVIVAMGVSERLSNRLWDLEIPLLVYRSVGFYEVARLHVKYHYIGKAICGLNSRSRA